MTSAFWGQLKIPLQDLAQRLEQNKDKELVTPDVLENVVKCLGDGDSKKLFYATQIVAKISEYPEFESQLLNKGAISPLIQLLSFENEDDVELNIESVRLNALTALANLGKSSHCQESISLDNGITELVRLYQKSPGKVCGEGALDVLRNLSMNTKLRTKILKLGVEKSLLKSSNFRKSEKVDKKKEKENKEREKKEKRKSKRVKDITSSNTSNTNNNNSDDENDRHGRPKSRRYSLPSSSKQVLKASKLNTEPIISTSLSSSSQKSKNRRSSGILSEDQQLPEHSPSKSKSSKSEYEHSVRLSSSNDYKRHSKEKNSRKKNAESDSSFSEDFHGDIKQPIMKKSQSSESVPSPRGKPKGTPMNKKQHSLKILPKLSSGSSSKSKYNSTNSNMTVSNPSLPSTEQQPPPPPSSSSSPVEKIKTKSPSKKDSSQSSKSSTSDNNATTTTTTTTTTTNTQVTSSGSSSSVVSLSAPGTSSQSVKRSKLKTSTSTSNDPSLSLSTKSNHRLKKSDKQNSTPALLHKVHHHHHSSLSSSTSSTSHHSQAVSDDQQPSSESSTTSTLSTKSGSSGSSSGSGSGSSKSINRRSVSVSAIITTDKSNQSIFPTTTTTSGKQSLISSSSGHNLTTMRSSDPTELSSSPNAKLHWHTSSPRRRKDALGGIDETKLTVHTPDTISDKRGVGFGMMRRGNNGSSGGGSSSSPNFQSGFSSSASSLSSSSSISSENSPKT
eukprot:TRINITY_DN751_c2_g2_i1.p1 TRINITY_DN751_c2_g2~~TRINITY_DN751_c2_g2_i1.p1  ORF type:complete len:728 (-),score=261.64 TRINITY_DN751_c2_g2_i1:100-2283(-)